jgi:hypothetical protein
MDPGNLEKDKMNHCDIQSILPVWLIVGSIYSLAIFTSKWCTNAVNKLYGAKGLHIVILEWTSTLAGYYCLAGLIAQNHWG